MSLDVVIVSVISGGLTGGIVGAVVSHFLASSREDYARNYANAIAKKERKREFLSFMRSWRIDTVRHGAPTVAKNFEDNLRLFEAEVAKILSDYDKPTVEGFAGRICGIRLSRLQEHTPDHNEPGKEELLTEINAFMEFVSAN